MPFQKGLDPQVSLWRSSDQAVDEIRFSSDPHVYATCQIKYTNLMYWQDEIQTRILRREPLVRNQSAKKTGDSDRIESVSVEKVKNTTGDAPKKMSLDSFKEKHTSQSEEHSEETQENLLEYAISCGQNDFLNILIQSGTDVNIIVDGKDKNKMRTMLHLAVLNTDILRLKYLISHAAYVNCTDYKGQTPLHLSILPASVNMVLRHKDITRYLLNNGADINMQDDEGYTVLHRAVIIGDMDLVEFFLQQGVDISLRDKKEKTAVDCAGKHTDYITDLIEEIGSYKQVQAMWCRLIATDLISNVFTAIESSCPRCLRKPKDCATLRHDNYRYWMYVHDKFIGMR